MLKLKNRPIAAEDDGWTPRRLPGGVYCSPRCGCRCTKAAFDLATKQSNDLCAQLGEGWKPRVLENGGWHWEVAKGPLANETGDGGVIVRWRRHSGKYDAEFRSALTGTNCTTQFFAEAAAAEDAIGAVRQDARTFITRLEADLAASL